MVQLPDQRKMSSSLPKLITPGFIKAVRAKSKALVALKKVDPSERYVILYPDSENAFVGMGFNLLNSGPAEEIYASASKSLNRDILKLCLEGPKTELLDNLENRDVAAFVTSHATVAKLSEESPHVIKYSAAAGGLGVGLINSLVFGGSISFEDGLDLVCHQARAMEKAAKIVPNAKLKIRFQPAARTKLICNAAVEHCIEMGIPEEIAICSVSKKISPHVVEISGHEEAIKYLEDRNNPLFEFLSVKRVRKTPFAYHTKLMKPACDFMRYYLEQKMGENGSYITDPTSSSIYSATSGERLRCTKSIIKDLSSYSVRPILVEPLLQTLYKRPRSLSQPNTLIVWDKHLHRTIFKINRLAGAKATVLEA